MKTRRVLLLSCAGVFASIDLAHKALHPAEFHHARGLFAAFLMLGLVVALIVLVPRIGSNLVAVGAGIACGGALGNLVSLFAWAHGVPDPLVVAGATHAIAFNLADLFALAGDALLLSAAVVHGLRHRELLRERV